MLFFGSLSYGIRGWEIVYNFMPLCHKINKKTENRAWGGYGLDWGRSWYGVGTRLVRTWYGESMEKV